MLAIRSGLPNEGLRPKGDIGRWGELSSPGNCTGEKSMDGLSEDDGDQGSPMYAGVDRSMVL